MAGSSDRMVWTDRNGANLLHASLSWHAVRKISYDDDAQYDDPTAAAVAVAGRGCVDERIEVNIFEQHRTHPEPMSRVGFFVRIESASSDKSNRRGQRSPRRRNRSCRSASTMLLLTSLPRRRMARFGSTNGLAITGLCFSRIRRTLPRSVLPSWVRLPAWRLTSRNVERRSSGLAWTRLKTMASGPKIFRRLRGSTVNYPIIGDTELKIAKLYDMLASEAGDSCEGRTPADNAPVRTVFVIGPDKKIKLTLAYPMTTGRNFDEIIRVLDSMQLTAKHKVATPANWKQGEDVIITGAVSNDDAAKIFPGYKTVKPYLRTTTAAQVSEFGSGESFEARRVMLSAADMSTGGEVANALVCKTSIHGFNSHPVLQYFSMRNPIF